MAKDAVRSAAAYADSSSLPTSNLLQQNSEFGSLFPSTSLRLQENFSSNTIGSSPGTAKEVAVDASLSSAIANLFLAPRHHEASMLFQNSMNDSSRSTIHDPSFQNVYQPLNFNPFLQSQFGNQLPHLQWQGQMFNNLQQHSQRPSTAIELSGSSLRYPEASSEDALAHQALHARQPNQNVQGGTRKFNYFSKELKREFCLFRMRWLAEQSIQGIGHGKWNKAHLAFFKAKFPNYNSPETFQRTTRNWWSQRATYLTPKELEKSNGEIPDQSRCCGGSDHTDTVGIDSEDIDAEQSQAAGAAFPDASAADANAADAAPHREPGAQALAQFLSSEVDQAADAARAAAAAVDAHSQLVPYRAIPVAAAAAEGAFRPATLHSAIEVGALCCWHHGTQTGAGWSAAVVGAWVGWSRAHAMAGFI